MKPEEYIKKIREEHQKTIDSPLKGMHEKYTVFEHFPLNRKQCLYVSDRKSTGIVYEKGLENFTGYSLNEFNTDGIIKYTHPEDRELVINIITGVLNHVLNTSTRCNEPHLLLSYRLLKQNGKYCKVLVQSSVFERDKEGRMISNLSIMTDISFLDTHDRVEWEFCAEELDLIAFKKVIYSLYSDLYTKREKEIITLMDKKNTSQEIADKLCLSKLTVQTHRKNILKKAKSHSINDVLAFCKKNGVIE